MPATKIINVLKNDSFEDIFDLFKNAEAEEVILIFPKGSKFAKQGQYFEVIKNEADRLEKIVSIMSTDPVIMQLAANHGLGLLADNKDANPKKHQPLAPIPTEMEIQAEPVQTIESNEQNIVQEQEVETTEPDIVLSCNDARETLDEGVSGSVDNAPEEEIAHEESPDIILAASKNDPETIQTIHRTIKDIIRPEPEHSIKIKEEKTPTFELDIRSSFGEERSVNDIAKVWASKENDEKKSFFPSGFKPKPSKLFKKTSLIIAGSIVLLVALAIVYSILGNAKITISPKKQDLNFQLKVSASISTNIVDPSLNHIPGQRFSDAEEESDIFPATGQQNVVQKASGKITIFNKGSSSQRLVATTRFKTSDGLIFRIPQTISVPAATKVGSTITEGSIESLVYADKPGPEYNIAPTQFTIPGFDGTPKAGEFYAKSDQPMTGGIVGPSKTVTEEDFTKAQDAVTSKLKDKITNSLKNQASELKILDSTSITFEAPVTNAKVGNGADNLQMTIKGSADVIAFRESDVLELVRSYVGKGGDLELLLNGLTLTYSGPQMSADNSMSSFNVQVSGRAAVKIDMAKILKDILGMKEADIRSYFASQKDIIESAKIILSPFWVRNIPADPKKVILSVDNG